MTDRDVHLVLDVSAILAYGQGSLDVGETLAEVGNEGGAVAVPLSCLAVADAPMDMLEVLVRNPTAFVFADEPGEWRALTAMCDLTGGLPAASTALAAIDWNAAIFTRTPAQYEKLGQRVPLIVF